MAASTQHSSPSSASASAAGIPKPTAATTPKHSPSASSLCTCKSFLFAAFVAFAAAVAAKRLETIRVQELDVSISYIFFFLTKSHMLVYIVSCAG